MLRSAKQQTWLTDQEELWKQIDEAAYDKALTEQYLAVMDKKPIVMDGLSFMDREIATPPFIIEPFLPMGGLALLHGKRGIGKSFLGTTIMEAVCKGTPLFGVFPTTKGRVLYVQLDMTDTVFQDRLCQAGQFYRFEGWDVLTGVPNMMQANRSTDWVQKVHQSRPDLVIIDTLRKAHKLPENESDTPTKFLTKMRELFGAITIIMIHHDKKTSIDGGDPNEAFRGTGAWLDDMDVGMHIMKKHGKSWLEFSKVRTCPEIEPIGVELDIPNMRIVVIDDAMLSEASRARADARTFFKDSVGRATSSDVFQFLINKGYGKSTASRAKEVVF